MHPHRRTSGRLARFALALLALAVLLGTALATSPSDEDNMIVVTHRFGDPTGPTSVGFEHYTEIPPGQRFMYVNQSHFQAFLSGYTTTYEVQFPDSVVPDLSAYSAFAQVVGDKVHIELAHGGIGINIPFDVKPAADLPRGATEIRLHWSIRVTTPTRVLTNAGEDAIDLIVPIGLRAAAFAEPAEVQLEDAEPITVTVRVRNSGQKALKSVAPTGDPAVAGGRAQKTSGPTPASVSLAAGASADITYVYTPTKAGLVSFTFPGFRAKGPTGDKVTAASVATGDVRIKQDTNIDVTVETDAAGSLATDSTAKSIGVVRLRVTNAKGDPVGGQRVALAIPQYVGVIDLAPRLLICRADGTRAYPPGDDVVLNRAAYATTPENGEVTFQIRLGTERRSAQLLVVGAVVDENGLDAATDAVFVNLPDNDHPPTPDLTTDLDALQRADLPPGTPPDSPGVTGTGTPLEVVKALTAWLLKQQASGKVLPDFVPVTSLDQAHAGVLFYPRTQLETVVLGSPAPGGYVLQVENLSFGAGHQVTWQRPLMPLSQWETASLNGQGLVEFGGSSAPRGRAVPAPELVTSSATAFLGYPYPAAAGGGGCGPVLDGVAVAVHSPVALLVQDAAGKSIGFDANGAFRNEIPGAVFAGGEPAAYILPPGSYHADVRGTGKGPATLVLTAAESTSTFTVAAKPGASGSFTFDDTLSATGGTFGGKKIKVTSGVPIRVAGVKKRLSLHNGDPLALTVTDVFGAPVAGARVHATGTDVDLETLTGADGAATMPLVVTKATKRLTLTIDGAGVAPVTLRVSVKLLR